MLKGKLNSHGEEAMSIFEDRENAFESEFVHEQTIEFKAAMLPNRLLGVWVGEMLGLSGEALEDYVKTVIQSDLELPTDADVIRKVRDDLKTAKILISETELSSKMVELMTTAR